MIYIPLIGAYIFIVHSLNIISKAQLIASKKLKYYVYASTFSLITNVVLSILLIPKFGIYGAVFSTGLSGLVSSLILFFYGQKNYQLNLNYKLIIIIYTIYFISILVVLQLLNLEINFILKILIKNYLFVSYFLFFDIN